MPIEKVKDLLGDTLGPITEANKSKKMLKALEDDSVFETLFKIVE